jgi:thioesterase domain-containing protein
MGVEVVEATLNEVRLSAPLSPNINHMKTVFGGSASGLAMLSAWALLHIRLGNENIESTIVIHRSHMTFEHPIVGTFTSATRCNDDPAWEQFVTMLKEKGRAGIQLCSTLTCGGSEFGRLEGNFVSILRG